MNFPGLEPLWNGFHRSLKSAGVIRPFSAEECARVVAAGSKVLVVANTALGDALLCTPLLKSLSDQLGASRVGFLVRSPYVSLFEKTPWIGKIHSVPGKFRGFSELKKSLSGYQVALIANVTEPDLIPWLWWCGVRGFFRYKTRWSQWASWMANPEMMRRPGEPDYATGHAIENTLAMLGPIGLRPTCERLTIEVPEPNVADRVPTPYALIHPGASRHDKCWPLQDWAAVAKYLRERWQLGCHITGGPGEEKLAANLAKLLGPESLDFSGRFGLVRLAQLQASATVFLSGDTGPYHLAVAVRCPTVTLFAPRDRGSSIEACGPHKADPARHQAIQTKRLNASIQSISVSEVIEVLDQKLQETISERAAVSDYIRKTIS